MNQASMPAIQFLCLTKICLFIVAILSFSAAQAATLTVTTLTDEDSRNALSSATAGADGDGLSLREALRTAGDGDMIQFDPSLAGGTITLDSTLGSLYIDKSITIDGDPAGSGGQITIDGNNAQRPLFIDSGTVDINNFILQNGVANGGDGGDGGAGGGGGLGAGGGLFVNDTATVTITDVDFSNNSATGGTGGTAGGNDGGGGGGGLNGNGGEGRSGGGGGGGGLFGDGGRGSNNSTDGAGGGGGGAFGDGGRGSGRGAGGGGGKFGDGGNAVGNNTFNSGGGGGGLLGDGGNGDVNTGAIGGGGGGGRTGDGQDGDRNGGDPEGGAGGGPNGGPFNDNGGNGSDGGVGGGGAGGAAGNGGNGGADGGGGGGGTSGAGGNGGDNGGGGGAGGSGSTKTTGGNGGINGGGGGASREERGGDGGDNGGGGGGGSNEGDGGNGSDFGGGGGGGSVGGSPQDGDGGDGGFGAGGGGGTDNPGGNGGFGAGNGGNLGDDGDGGDGYGGHIFVRNGGSLTVIDSSSSSGSVNAGTGENDGTSDGDGIYIHGGNINLQVSAGTETIADEISGGGSITKTGTGALVISGANNYSGGTTISAGTLTGTTSSIQGDIMNNAALSFDQSTDGSYSSIISGTGSLTKSGSGNVTLSGANIYSGGTTISTGTLTGTTTSLQGDITNNATLVIDQAGSGTYSDIISGSGSVTKSGAGNVTLTGMNTYTGDTTVNAGTFTLGNNNVLNSTTDVSLAGGTTFDVNDFTQTIASLSGAGNVDLGSGTLTTGDGDSSTLSGNITGTGGIVKAGAGTLTLSGTNAYSGGTIVSAGVLEGTTSSLQDDITNNATVTFDQAADGTYSDVISGTGALTKAGTGNLTLSGVNTYSGGTTISAGTLTGTTTSLQGDITNNATLVIDQAGNATFSNIISGTGAFVKSGVSNLTLSGANTYSGGTTINAGTLTGTTSSLQGDIMNNAALEFDQTADGTYTSVISGTGSVTKSGTGNVTISGTNTYSGGTTITAGTLTGTTLSLQGDIVNTSELVFSQTTTGTYGDIISGSGNITKNGSGTVTLGGNNNYTGNTTVDAGTLYVNGSTASSALTSVGVNGTLGGTGTVGDSDISGILAPGNSIGTLNITGNLTFQNTGTFEVELDDTGATDLVAVTGNVNLNNVSLLVVPVTGDYTSGTIYTVLTTGGSISGSFGNTSDDEFKTAGLTFLINQTANQIDLEVDSTNLFTETVNAGTPGAVAVFLDSFENSGPLLPVINALNPIPVETLESALASISGDPITAIPEISQIKAAQIQSLVFDRLSFDNAQNTADPVQIQQLLGFLAHDTAIPFENENILSSLAFFDGELNLLHAENGNSAVWTRIAGQIGNRDTTSDDVGFNSYQGVLASGYEIKGKNEAILGVFGEISNAFSDFHNDVGENRTLGIGVGVYSFHPLGDNQSYLKYFGRTGVVDFSSERKIRFTGVNETAKGDTTGFDWQASFEYGQDFKHNDLGFSLFGGLDYQGSYLDGFTETGAGIYNLHYDSIDSHFLTANAGVEFKNILATYLSKDLQTNLRLGYSFITPLGDESQDVAFALSGDDQFTLQGVGDTEHRFRPSLSLDYTAPESNETYFFDYGGDIGNDYQAQSLLLGIKWIF